MAVSGHLTKADKKKVRQLAGIAWERELRHELRKIGAAIEETINEFAPQVIGISARNIDDQVMAARVTGSILKVDPIPAHDCSIDFCDLSFDTDDLVGIGISVGKEFGD